MKQEFTDIKTKLKEFYSRYMAIAKVYAQKWIAIVIKAQNDLYVLTHEWFTTHLPRVAQQYDKAPPWTQKGLFYLPWFCLFLIILNYFNVFDRGPTIKSVQDRNVVIVNDDLRNMITEGEVHTGSFVEELRASGRVDFNEMFLSRIGANVTGRVSDILAVPGQKVKQGDILAKITSTELTQSQLSFLKAKSASQLADQAANRARILYKEDVIALAELQKREAEASSAKAEYRAANDQLRVQGMDQPSIDRLAKSGVIESTNNVIASIPGEIVERKINKGQVVQPADALFTVADLNTLWAVSEIPESNSYLIHKGQKVSLIIPALRNAEIEGVVAHVDSIVNTQTRTVVVRMEVPNKDGLIKPGMLATMMIESQPTEKLLVPTSAVIREDNKDYVFVKEDDEIYRMIAVKLGPEGKGYRPVISGLKVGQNIAVNGAFHLNAERKRQLSGG
ncbi:MULTISPECIES: efflux RND transporter periplasmic adaptor subunit [unclassified Polynucleobacter]|uniref:efflux RND transporter periplasmic adaptor subunit n=1 Tax=unclassified Polynucleobacter TaxID=2640945 RepID=UPI0008D45883|nr:MULTISPECIES: efflux RND transporter periplasmic adaptor subunit [unclassified Polynucleobacter]OHC09916.1 MAG: efflux transporter periplasmic adaptor subunit [Polynucleobacter sp. GWA2_45_21]HBK42892.1 efflux transporter periplasmic adaptor subunit [Polynucleobacter sp.]